MRVNSVFKDVFNNRFVMAPGMVTILLAIFFISSSFTTHPGRNEKSKQVNLLIRLIGHRLLLQSGDSTSYVLPVTEIKEGTFVLAFENELVFSHDSLIMMSRDLFPKKQFPSGYTVTVHDCLKAGIVYGFQVNNTSPDNLACQGRRQPAGCYTIEFAFPDLYKEIEQKRAATQPTEEPRSSEVESREDNVIPIESEESDSLNADQQQLDTMPKEPESFKVDLRQATSTREDLNNTTFHHPLIDLVFSGTLGLLGVTLLIGRFGKILMPLPVRQDQPTIKDYPELPALGKFLFDVKNQRLLLDSEAIPLTDKECKILELLNESFGELISRDTLMQKVWINEGVITGRSLDMFVSKLRKKLSGDPELRITNVHGKGYKLEDSVIA